MFAIACLRERAGLLIRNMRWDHNVMIAGGSCDR